MALRPHRSPAPLQLRPCTKLCTKWRATSSSAALFKGLRSFLLPHQAVAHSAAQQAVAHREGRGAHGVCLCDGKHHDAVAVSRVLFRGVWHSAEVAEVWPEAKHGAITQLASLHAHRRTQQTG